MYLMARAYSLAQASVVAPFKYATLPINAIWGFLLWREVPPATTWLGALLTVVSEIYIVYREQREQVTAKAADQLERIGEAQYRKRSV